MTTAAIIFLLIGAGCALVFSQKGKQFCTVDCASITALFEEVHDDPSTDPPLPMWTLKAVNSLLIVAVLLTFPLQLFPAVQVH